MNTLERLKELEEKATHGPWRWHLAYGSGFIGTSKNSANDVACAVSSEDCELIVEMRNALPKLLAVVNEGKQLARYLDQFMHKPNPMIVRYEDVLVLLVNWDAKLKALES